MKNEINKNNDAWKNVKLEFGKYKGWTLFQVYVNDPGYLFFLNSITLKEDLKSAVEAAINHKNSVDPFSN